MTWWLLPLIGFFLGSGCVYFWQGRGILAGFVIGMIVGQAIAVYVALVLVPQMQPPPAEGYLQNPGFVIGAGLFWAVLWWGGHVLGIPAGLLLRERKNSN
jgi:hypothetical protein